MGSIRSDFKFNSFKVDKFIFNVEPFVELIEDQSVIDPSAWEIDFKIRVPSYFVKRGVYLGGLDIRLALTIPKEEVPERDKDLELVKLDAGIVGTFSTEERFADKAIEEKLVKFHIPTLLLPYLRSAVTGFLASAGFGNFIFPLINIHHYAQESLKDCNITIIE
ncbi:protein-export chaperone SecB [Pseudodesulfovibrio senegalensis]|uniref:Protein-export chaperone SecB n=1 Tax=Pseudodesulfovibrio senegalensis TaxID=1721087 RepID=A0A6N6N677_9BACT|nr:protein-export chaperone SecB [Pseudodesulfovibrio senegalensis]KAB1443574.1 hypothetical protein F8A88_04835 [Pseudodesulfovibrio senegalensis]